MFLFTHVTLKDLPEILAIERASFNNPWSKESFTNELSGPLSCTIIAKSSSDSLACGYCCYRVITPEAELLRIAVRPEERLDGVGRALLDEMFRLLRLQQVTTVYLEVSETNQAALALYKKSGFLVTGRRPGYYDQDTTAALLLQRNLLFKVGTKG